MTYAVKQDLVDRFGEKELRELTDRVNRPPTTIDDTIVGRALDDATALIDGYVGKKYALPLAETPPMLVKVASDLARYFLHGKSADKDSPVTAAYKQAVDWLRDVSRGLVDLGDGSIVPAVAGGGDVRTNTPERPLSAETMKGYI